MSPILSHDRNDTGSEPASGFVLEDERLKQLAEKFGVEYVDLDATTLDFELIQSFPIQELFRYRVLPISRRGQRVRIAVSDPFKLDEMDELTVATGCFLDTVLAAEEQITRHLNLVLGVAGGAVRDMIAQSDAFAETITPDADFENANSSSVGKIVYELLSEAVRQRASDIHIETNHLGIGIRYRVDGLLRTQSIPPGLHRFCSAIISRLKIMARLNIAERRLPQDGRLQIELAGRAIDVRASFIPMLDGEEVVLRILDRARSLSSLDEIGLPSELGEIWKRLIHRPHGLVLVTGPTGSGKTTTLYSSLLDVRDETTKTITVEDPVEYKLAGISQIQVHDRVGLSFSEGLRSILRHDPDVILIGEIRDRETATSAVQAALTGHLVFSTLHTNDASSAIIRMVDMGVEPYLVSGVLQGVLAQRLVRRLCVHCRQAYSPEPTDALPLGCEVPSGSPIFRAVGCSECANTGYFGRQAIFELLVVNDRIRQQHASLDDVAIRQTAIRSGMATLLDCGWSRVLDGTTSVDEILRVCCA